VVANSASKPNKIVELGDPHPLGFTRSLGLRAEYQDVAKYLSDLQIRLATALYRKTIFQMTYSSSYEVLSTFTRDFEVLKSKLSQCEEQDKSCLEPVLTGVNKLVLGEWGTTTPCQVTRLFIILCY
jgi:hypothetical protein